MVYFVQNFYCGLWIFTKPAFSVPIYDKISDIEKTIKKLSEKPISPLEGDKKKFDVLVKESDELKSKIKDDLGKLVGSARAITALANAVVLGAFLTVPRVLKNNTATNLLFAGMILNAFSGASLYLIYDVEPECFRYYKKQINKMDLLLTVFMMKIENFSKEVKQNQDEKGV